MFFDIQINNSIAISWRYAFAVYLIAGIVLVLVVLFLKELPKVEQEKYEKKAINTKEYNKST